MASHNPFVDKVT